MPDGGAAKTVRLAGDIASIDAKAWDACAAGGGPFVCHAFLLALEESGSVGRGTGWMPRHVVLEADGRLFGAAPLYLKSHSYGEYVFDHGWARAWEQAGGRYYPKLLSAAPFTPVTGRRLLVAPDAPAGTAALLIRALEATAETLDTATLHVNFPTAEEADQFAAAGWLRRMGVQYHWLNDGYRSFDDFLATLNSRRRKDIRRERQKVAAAGVSLRILSGGDLKTRHWDAFDRFYRDTSDRKWGSPYLTRAFFDRLGETMADRVALVMAEKDGHLVAGALNLIGDDVLYGRNWGCAGDFRFLHFEACYYQAIDFAIERGLARVEAGAQGEHKIQRGYHPTPTWSVHLIRDRQFRAAVADFLGRETAAMEAEIAALSEGLPFRRDCPDQ
jgi:predicted N-acyltransferase